MRYFFYSFSLILSLSLFVNDASAATLLESCPYGYRNVLSTGVNTGTDNSTSGPTYLRHRNKYNSYVVSDPTFTVSQTDEFGNAYYYATFQYVIVNDCAITPADDIQEDGCYPSEITANSQGLNTCQGNDTDVCYSSSGASIQVMDGKTCSDYCPGDNPQTLKSEQYSRCSLLDESDRDPLSDSDPTLSDPDPDLTPNCPAGTTAFGDLCVAEPNDDGGCNSGMSYDSSADL